jgi:polyhydroxybutyrate depolymerase
MFVMRGMAPSHAMCRAWPLPEDLRMGVETRDFEHQGVGRHTLVVNAKAAKDRPRPLWLVLHGGRGADAPHRTSPVLDVLAKNEGIVVAYPSAIAGRWSHQAARPSTGATATTPVDDQGFLVRLIDTLVGDRIADHKRIYVSGFSSGGFMTWSLLCAFPERFAAAAPMSASMTEAQMATCKPQRAVPLVVFAGTADRIVRYDGALRGETRIVSIPEALEFWRRHHGCGSQSVTDVPHLDPTDPTRVERIDWSHAQPSGPEPLRLYRVEGGGHTLPTLTPHPPEAEARDGRRNRDFEASELAWEFLKQWSLP